MGANFYILVVDSLQQKRGMHFTARRSYRWCMRGIFDGRQNHRLIWGHGLHFALGGLDEWGLHIGVNCVYTLVNSMKNQAVNRVLFSCFFIIVCSCLLGSYLSIRFFLVMIQTTALPSNLNHILFSMQVSLFILCRLSP